MYLFFNRLSCSIKIDSVKLGRRNKLNLRDVDMKKIVLILGTIFLILTLIGSGYVLINQGQVSAGYAAIPALWTMICFGYYQRKKND